GYAPLIIIQDVRCHDLEIIIRRVRKRASAVTVSHRPDPGHVSAQTDRPPEYSRADRWQCQPCLGQDHPYLAAAQSPPTRESQRPARSCQLIRPFTAMQFPCLSTPTTLLSRRTSMPSSLRNSATALETSSSSRAINRGASSITVTSLP